MFINDVGAGTWEEINDGIVALKLRMAQLRRGLVHRQTQTSEIHYFNMTCHRHTVGAPLSAALFTILRSTNSQPTFVGKYFFGDLCRGLDPADGPG